MSGSVAHLIAEYLGYTETFLDRQFRAYRRYEPWIYAERATQLERFPTDRLATLPERWTARLWTLLVGAHWTPWFLPLMRRRNTRVVHAHYGPTALRALPFVWRERWPLVASFYGYDVAFLRAPWRHRRHLVYGACHPLLFRAARRLLVLSRAMRDELVALGAPAARIEIHRNGVDLGRFRPAADHAPDGVPAVLMCGWEVEKKGFAFGFEALARVRRRGRPFRVLYHTARPGPLRPALDRTIERLGLGDLIERVPPEVPPAEVMRRASLILAPSVVASDGDREGVPTVLVEAAASGLPAVASRHTGILRSSSTARPDCVGTGRQALAGALERFSTTRRRRCWWPRGHTSDGADAARHRTAREIYDEVQERSRRPTGGRRRRRRPRTGSSDGRTEGARRRGADLLVAAARPNFMKVAPVCWELQRRGLPFALVHTGQHYDANMSDVFFRDLELPQPHEHLGVGSGTHAQQTAKVMLALEPVLERRRPGWVVVVGDVNSTLAATLTAVKLRIPTAHVEAGLRSRDWEMPEEINRVVTDRVADLLLTPSEDADRNLHAEGVPARRIVRVGNVMIDCLRRYLPDAMARGVAAGLGLAPGKYAVMTLHRPSNVDHGPTLAGILEAVETIARRLPVVLPVHPRTRARLEALGLAGRAREVPGLHLIEPLGYVDFLGLTASAALVLTDSGGLQEESSVLGIPCLTLRENTERPVTVSLGTNRVVGVDPQAIRTAAAEALDRRPAAREIPLWDGRTAGRIVDALTAR